MLIHNISCKSDCFRTNYMQNFSHLVTLDYLRTQHTSTLQKNGNRETPSQIISCSFMTNISPFHHLVHVMSCFTKNKKCFEAAMNSTQKRLVFHLSGSICYTKAWEQQCLSPSVKTYGYTVVALCRYSAMFVPTWWGGKRHKAGY